MEFKGKALAKSLPRVHVRKRSSPIYVYTKLCYITEANVKINIYGVIQSVQQEPTLNRKGKLHAIVNIIDETVRNTFSVNILYDPSSEKTTLELKENYIVRFHRLKIERHFNVFDGQVFSAVDILLFHPNDEDLSDDDLISWCFAKTICFIDSDAVRVRELIKWWSEYSAMSSISTICVSAATDSVKFLLICKVLKVIRLDNENSMVVTITDGTKCPLKVKKILTESSVDTALSDRGCFRKNVYDIDIIIFNASDELKRLREGQFVKLGFIMLKHPTEGNADSYLFVLDGTYSYIRVFKEHHFEAEALSQRITNSSDNVDNILSNLANGEHAYSLSGLESNFTPEDTEMIELPTNEPDAGCNNTSTSPPNVLLKQSPLKLSSGAKQHDKNNINSILKTSTQYYESEFSRNTCEDNVTTMSKNYGSQTKKENLKRNHNSTMEFNRVDTFPELSPVKSVEETNLRTSQRAKRAKMIVPVNNASDEDESGSESICEHVFEYKISDSANKETEERFHNAQIVQPCKKLPRINVNNKTPKMQICEKEDAERFPCLHPNADGVLHNCNYFKIKGWIKCIDPFDPDKKEDFVCGYCQYCRKFKPYSRIKESIQHDGRILCATCGSRETESELKLVFHFHAKVIDEFNQTFKLVADTDAAAKLFGCGVKDYLKVPWLQDNVFTYLSKTIITDEESKKNSNAFSFLVGFLNSKFYLADVRHKPLL